MARLFPTLLALAALAATAVAANPTPAACGIPLDVLPQKPEQGGKFCVIPWDDNDCEQKEDVCISKCKLGFKECNANSCKGYPAPRNELIRPDGGISSTSNVAYFSNTTGVSVAGSLVKVVDFAPREAASSASIVATCPTLGRAYAIEQKVTFIPAVGTGQAAKYFADKYEKVLAYALDHWDDVCEEQPSHARKIQNPRKIMEDWCDVISGSPDPDNVDKCYIKN